PAPAPAPGPAPAGDARAITDVLVRSTEGWNRRDLDAFMEPYAPDATFVGSRGLVRGKAAVREMYATSWFAPGRDPGQLRFEDIEVRMLGRGHALAVGRYVVEAAGRDPATGLFSLTLRRTPAGWRIVHDHSS
ncbi:MAG: nuclear transport factor 2 family protein, partial [Gemmatimonadetes bacterium]|nr:nuclear transport factor 2 family protein [Gemmatimonadota bacterium]